MEYPQLKIQIFVSYSHDDVNLLVALQKHFAPLRRHRAVDLWTDREIVPGTPWDDDVQAELESADLILLLISSSFLASDFCYEVEMRRALERHSEGTARVVPIILRPCDWMESPFAKLQALPKHAKAITSWEDADTAMTDVAKGIRRLLNTWKPSTAEIELMAEPNVSIPSASSRPNMPPSRDLEREPFARELEAAYAQRDSLQEARLDTTAIDTRILDLKRQLRSGPQLQPGEFLGDGRFQLVNSIGQGGFATVWLALDRTTRTKVAVKILHGQFSTSEERRERLFRGARQMAKLDHPHIVKVLTPPKVEDGWAFFVMEYLEGGDFRRAVLDGRLNIVQRLAVLEKVAQAIDHAHEHKVVHRDIKPANILLDADGLPKLTDFDLVLAEDSTGLTRTKAGMGSYHYAAPESMDDAAGATARCDVYSLAATLVFALQGKELNSSFLIQREAYLKKLRLANGALEVLRRGLHLDPKVRHGSTVELVQSLWSTVANITLETKSTDKETGPRAGLSRPQILGSGKGILFHSVETCDGVVPLWTEIPAGEGWIGSTKKEEGRLAREGPKHQIRVTRPFWLAVVPVTNAQFAAFDKSRADLKQPNHPVVRVSWFEALGFCEWLGQEQRYQGARLPTEEEWEYACRAASSTRFWSGNDVGEDLERVSWFNSNSGNVVHPVAEKLANPWGLYDMHGNVWEWTASLWKDDYSGQAEGLTVDSSEVPTDLAVSVPRGTRVFRGGGFWDSVLFTRSSYRSRRNPGVRLRDQGFRVLLPSSPYD